MQSIKINPMPCQKPLRKGMGFLNRLLSGLFLPTNVFFFFFFLVGVSKSFMYYFFVHFIGKEKKNREREER
jgi:hypothetical protein